MKINAPLKYKGYRGTATFNNKDREWHGELQGITGFISYGGETMGDLTRQFEEAVEFWLDHIAIK